MEDEPRNHTEERTERFRDLLKEWREVATAATEEAEEFARRKPGTALAGAFLAGWIASRFLGRRG